MISRTGQVASPGKSGSRSRLWRALVCQHNWRSPFWRPMRGGGRARRRQARTCSEGRWRWQSHCGSNQARQQARGRNVSISSCRAASAQSQRSSPESSRDACC